MKVRVYIDGVNLYYGSLKDTTGGCFKWLNVETLVTAILPGLDVEAIKYSTARASDTPTDPSVSQRQQMYIRALESIPHLKVIYGRS